MKLTWPELRWCRGEFRRDESGRSATGVRPEIWAQIGSFGSRVHEHTLLNQLARAHLLWFALFLHACMRTEYNCSNVVARNLSFYVGRDFREIMNIYTSRGI